MTLPELIKQFDLASLTHRRQVLEPTKLEYLNKHHLMRDWQTDQGTSYHAHRIHELVRDTFPSSPHTSPEYIAKVIHILQGRITNIQDVPALAPYFFVGPDYATPEAQRLRDSISNDDYRRALQATVRRLAAEPDAHGVSSLASLVHGACETTGIKQKAFMTALRHALTAMKTGPTVPETIDVLGVERSVRRLDRASMNSHAT